MSCCGPKGCRRCLPAGNAAGDLLVWSGTAWVPRAALASSSAALAVDTTIAAGAPVVGLLSANITIAGTILLVEFTVNCRATSVNAGWRALVFQVLVDGVQVAAGNTLSYNPVLGLQAYSSGKAAARVTGLAPGLHVVTVDAQCTADGMSIFPVTRPLNDSAVLVAQELMA